ncbi:hypothetical protein AWC22_17540 [Mycobacterium riyadhense]|uniref:Uncharacterized protein n=1 Tax=Mycobacterium riyadhense TaxID=486698 RepID=A0A1X2CYE0_9MYCO|nr:hypothetical protein AWC22_17540 [Mycobacterium riyadhense]
MARGRSISNSTPPPTARPSRSPRFSLLHIVERSITDERLITELETAYTAAGGPPKMLRIDNARSWIPKRDNSSASTGPTLV